MPWIPFHGITTKISILHCVSQYPTDPLNVNLRTIDWLRENYPPVPYRLQRSHDRHLRAGRGCCAWRPDH